MKSIKLPTLATTNVYEIGDNTNFLRFCPGCNYVLGNDGLCHNNDCAGVVDADSTVTKAVESVSKKWWK